MKIQCKLKFQRIVLILKHANKETEENFSNLNKGLTNKYNTKRTYNDKAEKYKTLTFVCTIITVGQSERQHNEQSRTNRYVAVQ